MGASSLERPEDMSINIGICYLHSQPKHQHRCTLLTSQLNPLLEFSTPLFLSCMPCSSCGTWVSKPSWHRCEKRCVNSERVAKLQDGNEIKCSRSWDDTYWFFFCDRCKKCRPYIRGVLSGARIWHSPYLGKTDYTTDSEYSYYSSEGEPCTQEEAEENYSIQEAARAKSLKNKTVECLSNRLITERLGIHLAAYTEIKLYRACKQIYLGNRARNNWWANMTPGGPITQFKWSAATTSNSDNAGSSSGGVQS